MRTVGNNHDDRREHSSNLSCLSNNNAQVLSPYSTSLSLEIKIVAALFKRHSSLIFLENYAMIYRDNLLSKKTPCTSARLTCCVIQIGRCLCRFLRGDMVSMLTSISRIPKAAEWVISNGGVSLNRLLEATVNRYSFDVIVWNAIWCIGRYKLVECMGNNNSVRYIIPVFSVGILMKTFVLFMHDGTSCHTSRTIQA